MAILAAIFNKPKKTQINVPSQSINQLDERFRDQAERQFMVIDATITTNHRYEATPTDHAVEDGSNISDHVDVKPKSISFDGFISESPIKLERALVGNVAGLAGQQATNELGNFGGSLVTGVIASLGGSLLNETNRVKNAHDSMLELMDKKIPCTIVTGLQTYKNMILTSYQPTESAANGNSLNFSATFKELRVITSQTVLLTQENLDQSVKHTAGKHQNRGKQPPVDPNEEVSNKSWAVSGWDSLRGA